MSIDDTFVFELDAPPRAFFKIPLDWFANDNGELESPEAVGAVRLTQEISFTMLRRSFRTEEEAQAWVKEVVKTVRDHLLGLGGNTIIWWRNRPEVFQEDCFKASLRLGTSPTLSARDWQELKSRLKHADLVGPI